MEAGYFMPNRYSTSETRGGYFMPRRGMFRLLGTFLLAVQYYGRWGVHSSRGTYKQYFMPKKGLEIQ
jgi:hypothetical protein